MRNVKSISFFSLGYKTNNFVVLYFKMCTGNKILGGSNFSIPKFAELLKLTKANNFGVLGFVLLKLFYLLQKTQRI